MGTPSAGGAGRTIGVGPSVSTGNGQLSGAEIRERTKKVNAAYAAIQKEGTNHEKARLAQQQSARNYNVKGAIAAKESQQASLKKIQGHAETVARTEFGKASTDRISSEINNINARQRVIKRTASVSGPQTGQAQLDHERELASDERDSAFNTGFAKGLKGILKDRQRAG